MSFNLLLITLLSKMDPNILYLSFELVVHLNLVQFDVIEFIYNLVYRAGTTLREVTLREGLERAANQMEPKRTSVGGLTPPPLFSAASLSHLASPPSPARGSPFLIGGPFPSHPFLVVFVFSGWRPPSTLPSWVVHLSSWVALLHKSLSLGAVNPAERFQRGGGGNGVRDNLHEESVFDDMVARDYGCLVRQLHTLKFRHGGPENRRS